MKKRLIFLFASVFYSMLFLHPVFGSDISKVMPQAAPYDLRCQSLKDPIGIGEAFPGFSWKLSSSEKSVIQTAYQVVVASSIERLDHDPDLWNSGKIFSNKSTFIHYAGKALQSAAKYYWKVKVWTNKQGKDSWSEPAYFITGLLKTDDWKDAKWIAFAKLADSLKVYPGVPGSGDQLGNKDLERAVVPYFRKGFSIHKKIASAYAYVCGLGQYAFYLNGKRVDTTFLNPAWSDYAKRDYYNTYDVTDFLNNGDNVMGAVVAPGFLYINRERYHKLLIAEEYPMLRLKLVIHYTDGAANEIVTDGSWRTYPSAVTFSSVYGGEDFDANKLQNGWNLEGFNGAAWKKAVVVRGTGGKMKAQESYPVEFNEVFYPVHIDSSDKKLWVYDFGQNTSGIVRFSAAGKKGLTIRIIPAELLKTDNTPDQDATGRPYYWQYKFKDSEPVRWQPSFSYYGFRYAGVEVLNSDGEPVDINAIRINAVHSLHTQNGAPQVGNFSCSDTLFNKIFQLIRWGIRNNLSNVATDCPHREKLGWLEESHLMGNSIQYNYDILRFYTKIIKDMIDAQLPDGLVPDIAPEYVVFSGGFRDSPEWGSACLLDPWYVYQWYGDENILQKSYSMMKRYVDYLGTKADHYLLAYGLGDWYDIGPNPPGVSQLTPLGVTATGFYYYDAKILGKVAAVLHHEKEAAYYRSLSDSIRRAFNQKYFNPASKVYATGSQTSFAIPLYFGIAPVKYKKQILDNLVDSIISHHYALTAGDIGFRYLMQTLEDNGYNEVIYKMNNREDVPGYGYQIKKGATALTESWMALRTVSNDHMMLGHLMEWFYSGLGGIRQQEGSVGYKKILIEPQFVKGVNWVNCSYNSAYGEISVQWKRLAGDKIQLHVEIPTNTVAKIVAGNKTIDTVSGNYNMVVDE
ncbi:MAG: alpha-L-rhamnosidase [Chitinophagaceae bacterium]|nr:MAG: alpha-L-rhamnosidase [Chitinophagaceae bacterium]